MSVNVGAMGFFHNYIVNFIKTCHKDNSVGIITLLMTKLEHYYSISSNNCFVYSDICIFVSFNLNLLMKISYVVSIHLRLIN